MSIVVCNDAVATGCNGDGSSTCSTDCGVGCSVGIDFCRPFDDVFAIARCLNGVGSTVPDCQGVVTVFRNKACTARGYGNRTGVVGTADVGISIPGCVDIGRSRDIQSTRNIRITVDGICRTLCRCHGIPIRAIGDRICITTCCRCHGIAIRRTVCDGAISACHLILTIICCQDIISGLGGNVVTLSTNDVIGRSRGNDVFALARCLNGVGSVFHGQGVVTVFRNKAGISRLDGNGSRLDGSGTADCRVRFTGRTCIDFCVSGDGVASLHLVVGSSGCITDDVAGAGCVQIALKVRCTTYFSISGNVQTAAIDLTCLYSSHSDIQTSAADHPCSSVKAATLNCTGYGQTFS